MTNIGDIPNARMSVQEIKKHLNVVEITRSLDMKKVELNYGKKRGKGTHTLNFLGGPLETDPKGNAWLARQIAEKTATTIAFFEQIITASFSYVK